jgi:UMF1 family MFS transporter
LERVSLGRSIATRERLGWVLYDWADSAFVLCVITVIGSAYFVGVFEAEAERAGALKVGDALALAIGGVAVTAEAAWSFIIAASALIVALSSPLLGAIADATGSKKRFLQVYCLSGALATAALWWGLPWWAVGLMILIGNIGFEGGIVFYNAFLPEIAPPGEQDLVSSWGYALGYIGGVIVLIAALLFLVPGALVAQLGNVRDSFILVALWWGGFAWITFSALQERPGRARWREAVAVVRAAGRELAATVHGIGRYPNAALFLLAFLFYNDGIATLISNATPYALQNVYLDRTLTEKVGLSQLIPAIILVQLVAFPGSLWCGWLAARYGEKRTIYFTLAVFTAVVAYGQVIQVVSEFYVMAALIGLVLGGAQAISRSLFASLIPRGKNAEFFAFFALSAKFSAMIGPLTYGLILLLTGSTREALLSLVAFFVLGGTILAAVNVQRGREQARAAAGL